MVSWRHHAEGIGVCLEMVLTSTRWWEIALRWNDWNFEKWISKVFRYGNAEIYCGILRRWKLKIALASPRKLRIYWTFVRRWNTSHWDQHIIFKSRPICFRRLLDSGRTWKLSAWKSTPPTKRHSSWYFWNGSSGTKIWKLLSWASFGNIRCQLVSSMLWQQSIRWRNWICGDLFRMRTISGHWIDAKIWKCVNSIRTKAWQMQWWVSQVILHSRRRRMRANGATKIWITWKQRLVPRYILSCWYGKVENEWSSQFTIVTDKSYHRPHLLTTIDNHTYWVLEIYKLQSSIL